MKSKVAIIENYYAFTYSILKYIKHPVIRDCSSLGKSFVCTEKRKVNLCPFNITYKSIWKPSFIENGVVILSCI